MNMCELVGMPWKTCFGKICRHCSNIEHKCITCKRIVCQFHSYITIRCLKCNIHNCAFHTNVETHAICHECVGWAALYDTGTTIRNVREYVSATCLKPVLEFHSGMLTKRA